MGGSTALIIKQSKGICLCFPCFAAAERLCCGGERMGPVTTNPWLIAVINMTIVFGVLIALGVLMSLIQVVDPTKAKAK